MKHPAYLPYYWSLFERWMIKRWSWSPEPFFCSQHRTREREREKKRERGDKKKK
jgi:hypothetical protein